MRPQTGYIRGKVLGLGVDAHRKCEVVYGKANVELKDRAAGFNMLVEPLEDVCIVRCLDEADTYRRGGKWVYMYTREIDGWVWWSD
jgi:hypothetical protein